MNISIVASWWPNKGKKHGHSYHNLTAVAAHTGHWGHSSKSSLSQTRIIAVAQKTQHVFFFTPHLEDLIGRWRGLKRFFFWWVPNVLPRNGLEQHCSLPLQTFLSGEAAWQQWRIVAEWAKASDADSTFLRCSAHRMSWVLDGSQKGRSTNWVTGDRFESIQQQGDLLSALSKTCRNYPHLQQHEDSKHKNRVH